MSSVEFLRVSLDFCWIYMHVIGFLSDSFGFDMLPAASHTTDVHNRPSRMLHESTILRSLWFLCVWACPWFLTFVQRDVYQYISSVTVRFMQIFLSFYWLPLISFHFLSIALEAHWFRSIISISSEFHWVLINFYGFILILRDFSTIPLDFFRFQRISMKLLLIDSFGISLIPIWFLLIASDVHWFIRMSYAFWFSPISVGFISASSSHQLLCIFTDVCRNWIDLSWLPLISVQFLWVPLDVF